MTRARGRPLQPYRDEVAWASVEFLRDRAGNLERDSVRGACRRLAKEMTGYFIKPPSASNLKNLHGVAVARIAAEADFKRECEDLLAKLRAQRDKMGSGFTIPEYLHIPIPGPKDTGPKNTRSIL
jgi:hypothetical protein